MSDTCRDPGSDPFSAIPPALAAQLREAGRVRVFRDGELVHGPSKPSHCLFQIVSGTVRFESGLADGRALEHARVGAGHWFGDIALMAGTAPPHDAVAVGATELLAVPESRFRRLLEDEPGLAAALARLSSRRLVWAYRELDALRSLSTPALVARALLDRRDPDTGEARLTQTELATLIGRSRSTVGSVLMDWRGQGIIATSRNRFHLLDVDALAALARH